MSLCNCHNCKLNCFSLQLVHHLGRNCFDEAGCNDRIAMQALSGALRLIGVWVVPKGAVCVLLNPPPSVQMTPTCVQLTDPLANVVQVVPFSRLIVLPGECCQSHCAEACQGICATCLCCFHTLLTKKLCFFLNSSQPGPGKAEVPALQLDAASTR